MAAVLGSRDLPVKVVEATDPAVLSAMIAGANAQASRVAPCLSAVDASEDLLSEARLVLMGAVQRWSEAGSGAYQQQTAGPFGITTDTRQRGGYTLRPQEISQLQALCRTASDASAFTVDTLGVGGPVIHADICALNFGALYCSCGAVLTGLFPLYEV